MKNQVNFYQPSLKPGSESLNLTLVLVCCALAMILVTGWSLYSNTELEQWQVAEETEKRHLEEARQRLQRLTNELKAEPDKRLVYKADMLQKQIQAQEYLLKQLGNAQQASHGTYAQLMLALASQHQQEIWLTHFTVTGNRLQIQGKSLNAESVPQWMEKLSKSDYFIGTEFGSLKVFRDEEHQLNFVLGATELPDNNALRPTP